MVSEKKGINQFSVKNKTEEIAQRSFNLSYICFLINISKLYLHVKIQFFSNSYFSILNSACFLSSMCHGFKKRKKMIFVCKKTSADQLFSDFSIQTTMADLLEYLCRSYRFELKSLQV